MSDEARDGTFALGVFTDGPGAGRFAGLVNGDSVLPLDAGELGLGTGGAIRSTLPLFEAWDEVSGRLEELVADRDRPWLALAGLGVHAPVAPRQVLQSGANYRQHVIDLGVAHHDGKDGRSVEDVRRDTAAMMDRRAATGTPYLFAGMVSSIGGPFDDVTLPAYSDQHDWELELAAVIGRSAYDVAVDDVLGHVAGYTIGNDLTTRDLVFRRDMPEIGTDWVAGKGAPGFTPVGPFVVPARFLTDPQDLRITLRLNGEVMQDESTKDMLFDVAAVIAAASRYTRLLPGDLVLTGSPAGNGMHHGRFLRPGDVMEGTITGLGRQEVRCVAAAAQEAGPR